MEDNVQCVEDRLGGLKKWTQESEIQAQPSKGITIKYNRPYAYRIMHSISSGDSGGKKTKRDSEPIMRVPDLRGLATRGT